MSAGVAIRGEAVVIDIAFDALTRPIAHRCVEVLVATIPATPVETFLAAIGIALCIAAADAERRLGAFAGAADATAAFLEHAGATLIDRRADSRVVFRAALRIEIAGGHRFAAMRFEIADTDQATGEVGQVLAFDRVAALIIVVAKANRAFFMTGTAPLIILANPIEVAGLGFPQADANIAKPEVVRTFVVTTAVRFGVDADRFAVVADATIRRGATAADCLAGKRSCSAANRCGRTTSLFVAGRELTGEADAAGGTAFAVAALVGGMAALISTDERSVAVRPVAANCLVAGAGAGAGVATNRAVGTLHLSGAGC